MSLPLQNFVFGIGDVNQPPAFQRDQADHDRLFHFYWQDTWKLRPRLALNFGLAWSFESNALNHDLTKPQFLAPIFGVNGLGKEDHAYLHFTPAAGFAWALPDNKTVFRGGGGIFYDTLNIETRLVERAYLGPLGTGYLPLPSSIVPNPIPVPGLPAGAPLDIRVPTLFSGTLLNLILPAVRAAAIQQLHVNPNNTDLTLRNIDVFKTGSDLFVQDFVPAQAQHLSVGRAAPGDQRFRRHGRFRLPPLHPRETTRRGSQPLQLRQRSGDSGLPAGARHRPRRACSNGPIQATISGGNGTYKALLVRADKRFSHHHSVGIAYALQSDQNIYGLNSWIRRSPTSIIGRRTWVRRRRATCSPFREWSNFRRHFR